MSQVLFIGDLHFGHQSICKFSSKERGGCTTVEEHDDWIIEQWNKVCTKNDLIYVLGDVCFDKTKLPLLKKLKGSKHLILGNHDNFSLKMYGEYFNKIHGFEKYKNLAWLSHCPIHPQELRGRWNVHGHVHQNNVDDLRYIGVSVESVNGMPISWERIQMIMEDRKCLMKLQKLNNQELSITSALTAGIAETSDSDDGKS